MPHMTGIYIPFDKKLLTHWHSPQLERSAGDAMAWPRFAKIM